MGEIKPAPSAKVRVNTAVSSIFAGSAPPDGFTDFVVQAGTYVVSGQTSGTVTFPRPFQNGILSIVIGFGDSPGASAGVFVGPTTLSTFGVASAGGATLFRVNWIAVGW